MPEEHQQGFVIADLEIIALSSHDAYVSRLNSNSSYSSGTNGNVKMISTLIKSNGGELHNNNSSSAAARANRSFSVNDAVSGKHADTLNYSRSAVLSLDTVVE